MKNNKIFNSIIQNEVVALTSSIEEMKKMMEKRLKVASNKGKEQEFMGGSSQ